jgi:hypothetical protein
VPGQGFGPAGATDGPLVEKEVVMDQDQMAKLLDEPGATADEVAASLKASGVQGIRNAARTVNIIVRHVQGRLRVDAWALDMMERNRLRLTLGDGRKVEAVIPEAVHLFLEAFNHGHYPALELPPDGA